MREKKTAEYSFGSAEDALFQKALRLLYERRLAMEGFRADIIPVRSEPEELPNPRATA